MKLYFNDIVIDVDNQELHRSGELLPVEPKVFGLLVFLAQNAQRVVSQDELLETVWKGRVVSDTTVAGCIKHARRKIGDDGNRQAIIKTVRGRGFRFCAVVSVTESDVAFPQVGAADPQTRPAELSVALDGAIASAATSTIVAENLVAADSAIEGTEFNPSLVIQAFQSFSEQVEMKSFVDGLSLALTTVLARIPLLRLSYQGVNTSPATPREIHESTGADYLLSGSAQVTDDHVRVTVQLSNARTGFNLWAHQFEIPGPLESAHEYAVKAIVARLEPQLHRAMYDTVRSSGSVPNALELYLQASGLLALRGWHHESFKTASELLRQSWKQAPEFAHAASYLSLVLGLGHRLGLMDNEQRAHDEALDAAERSLQMETMDSSVMGMAGCALSDLGQSTRAMSILKRAVELNPNNGQAWSALGAVALSERRVEDAISYLQRGMELSPHDSRLSVWGGVLATALRVSGNLSEAVIQARHACERDDRTYMPRVVLAGVYSARAEPVEARAALQDALRIKPDLTDKQVMYLVGRRLADRLMQP